LLTTSGDPAATPVEYARKHISAVYYDASPSMRATADVRQNDTTVTVLQFTKLLVAMTLLINQSVNHLFVKHKQPGQ